MSTGHEPGEESISLQPSGCNPVAHRGEMDEWFLEMDAVTRRRFLQTVAATGVSVALGSAATMIASAQTVEDAKEVASVASVAEVTLKINGSAHTLKLDPRVTLLDALRERIGLTGSKKGCDHGQCGACTVLVNGRRINSCLALAICHQEDEITTIEGLANGDELHPVQAAFIKHDGFQCGYCTPGQICSAVALLETEGCPREDAGIRELMSGNLCRCGAYNGILAAIREVRDSQPA